MKHLQYIMKYAFSALLVAVCLAAPARAADEKSTLPPASAAKPATKVKGVGVEDFDKLRSNRTNVVLDVRTASEYKAGHIPGAVNLDFRAADFEQKLGQLDKNKTYLVHCAGGVRSAKACKQMETLGFKELVDLRPGFMAWLQAGKPVEKGP